MLRVLKTRVVNSPEFQPNLGTENTTTHRAGFQSPVAGSGLLAKVFGDSLNDASAAPAAFDRLILGAGGANLGSAFSFLLGNEVTLLSRQRIHEPLEVGNC
jgi:hypothetical protein